MKKSRIKHAALAIKPRETPDPIAVLAIEMADDFNNILTTVLAACSLIDKNDHANGELLQYVALIRASAERAAILTCLLARVTLELNGPVNHRIGSGSDDTSVRDKKGIHDIVTTNNNPDGALS